jgi:hypothetical protein
LKVTDEMVERAAKAFVAEGWLEQNWDKVSQTHICPTCKEIHRIPSSSFDENEVQGIRNQIRFFLESALSERTES